MSNTIRSTSLAALTILATHALPVDALTRSGSRVRRIAGGAIAGIVIGCLVALVLAFILLWFCCCRSRRRSGGRVGQTQPVAPLAAPGMAEAGYNTGNTGLGHHGGAAGLAQPMAADDGRAYAAPTAPPPAHHAMGQAPAVHGEKQHFVGGFQQPGVNV